jgi:hypothetical protein
MRLKKGEGRDSYREDSFSHRISFREELLPLLEHYKLVQLDLEHVYQVLNRELEVSLILQVSSYFLHFHCLSSKSIEHTQINHSTHSN